MRRHRRICAALIGAMMVAPRAASAQQPPIKPSSPSVVAPPLWSRTLPLPDGRTFVTDGGLSVDAKLANPATMPSVVLPEHSGKIITDRMMAPHDTEVGLGELTTGRLENSYETPDGIAINGNYIRFLREILPSRALLRTRGKSNPLTIVVDGQAVGIMMPLAQPK